MKKFKLNSLAKNQLLTVKGGKFKEKFDEEMDKLERDNPGSGCSCACAYANNGGSSTSDNNSANSAQG
ncbi:MAG: hypothetical protein KQH79_11035 [Bacteroidetes bacterium]|nr:hypothetical protein [Bacteroidota bacterium]